MSKYLSAGHPELFEFHDSLFELDHADENDLAVYVRGLNISGDAEENPKGYDLEIRRAHILFRGISEFTYDPGRTWKTDEHGNSVPVGPEIIYRGEEARDRFRKDLLAGADIYSHTIVEGDYFEIYGCGREPFFPIRFKAREFAVEWDDYLGPAWYVRDRCFNRELVLQTAEGEVKTKARLGLSYDPDELFRAERADEVDPKECSVVISFEGGDYCGRGKDCSGQDAFADLQKQLPDGVFLKCCLSCRYGNQSPFSNAFDTLWCMKDVPVAEKTDLCRPMADPAEAEKRERHCTDICGDWAEQSAAYFTYSDYPLYLKD